jgi:diadenosine tetraphosphate (Ap4A) HIT family hydrolase
MVDTYDCIYQFPDFHVIPKYAGDTDNPRGGVRGVIPRKREH